MSDVLGQANCILRLGDVAWKEAVPAGARRCYEDALALYGRIQDPYSSGLTYMRLARLGDGEERMGHLRKARECWKSIDRADLVQGLVKEFGPVD